MHGGRNLRLSFTALLTAGALGCGGGDKGPTSATNPGESSSPSKNLFVKEANAICSQGSADLSKAAYDALPRGSRPTNAALIKFAGDRAIPILQMELDAIKRLRPPEGDEETIKVILREAQSNIDDLNATPLAFSVRTQFSVFDKTNQPAQRYGLVPCGSVR